MDNKNKITYFERELIDLLKPELNDTPVKLSYEDLEKKVANLQLELEFTTKRLESKAKFFEVKAMTRSIVMTATDMRHSCIEIQSSVFALLHFCKKYLDLEQSNSVAVFGSDGEDRKNMLKNCDSSIYYLQRLLGDFEKLKEYLNQDL